MSNELTELHVTSFQLVGDPANSDAMAKYMQDRYPFLGLKAPARREQAHALTRESKTWVLPELFAAISALYARPEREYQYVAIELAQANVRRLDLAAMTELSQWIMVKSWWDTVDAWRKVFGLYVVRHPEDKAEVFALFYRHENIWMRRIAILLQLLETTTMDTEMLRAAIMYDRTTDEFFLQKAIGWALRNYGKFDPVWVRAFLRQNGLSHLAMSEAQKYL